MADKEKEQDLIRQLENAHTKLNQETKKIFGKVMENLVVVEQLDKSAIEAREPFVAIREDLGDLDPVEQKKDTLLAI